jgi:hypothetical protein
MIDGCQSVLDTRPHVFPAVSDHVLLLEQQARPEIAMTQEQAIAGILDAIRQLMAPPPEQKKSPIGLPMTNARKSRRWRDGDACGTKSIAMLTRFVVMQIWRRSTTCQRSASMSRCGATRNGFRGILCSRSLRRSGTL